MALLVLFNQSFNTGAIGLKMVDLFCRENHLLRCWCFSSKLDWGSYIISVAKIASKEIVALICAMKFRSSEVAVCISINLP